MSGRPELLAGPLLGRLGAPSSGPARRNARLEAELRAAAEDLRASRARVAQAADAERRRIERDLHDGAQQRLIALRIKLALAEELEAPAEVAALIRELAGDVESAIDDLQALVHGVYPSLLIDRGPAGALRALGREAPVPVRVSGSRLGRRDAGVEAAVYFTCAEAIQNAIKHAGRGAAVRVTLRREAGGLAFEVRDDGRGMPARARAGRGLANMHDRIGAVGGRLEVASALGCGTAVQGWVPDA
jgi:signal transduction histidine kinase